MTAVISIKPLLAISCPIICAFLIFLFRKRPNIRESCTIIAGIVQFLIIISMAPTILHGSVIKFHLLTVYQGIDFSYKVDAFGLIFAITSSFLWILVSLYSIGYMRALEEHAQTRFYFMFALAIFSAVSIAMSENLITFYLFYEALTLSTYWLVAHHEDEEAFFGGRKYLTYLLSSGWFLFAAVVLTYVLAGTTDFVGGGILTSGSGSRFTLTLLFALFALGSMKAAWMPFHSWLPSAMVAPTPVSALLHAVAVVKAGVFAVLKVTIYIFGADFITSSGANDWLIWFAGGTILLASLVAMTRDNLKLRLAYSTISQLSYVVLGALLATNMGLLGGALHISMHAFAKITLFFAAGAILVAANKSEVSDMGGLGRAMPITFGAFLIGSLSIIGLPPFGGMWSKWYLGLGTVESGQWLLLSVLLISSLLNIAYLLPVSVKGFFGKTRDGTTYTRIKEAPVSCLIAMMITSLACVLLFFYPDPFYELALNAAGGK